MDNKSEMYYVAKCELKFKKPLKGHSRGVGSVAYNHDTTICSRVWYESTIKEWDLSTGTCLVTLKGHSGYVMSVAYNHDSTKVIS